MLSLRPILALAVAALALLPAPAPSIAQDKPKPPDDERQARRLPFQPDLPNTGSNHRLILKDGSYQLVRKYEVLGDRVRYISTERGGEWEELPLDLIDWEATRKWERDHVPSTSEASPAMKEAADIDKEEADARAEQHARRPEVAKGLELPDSDGVWIFDVYKGTPELVELVPSEMTLNGKERHGLTRLNPVQAAREDMELAGTHARVHLHVNDPAIYLSLDDRAPVADKYTGHALTVNTGGAHQVGNSRHGAQSERSGFALVKLDERNAVRLVGAIHIGVTGSVTQSENILPTRSEVLPGKHWLKIVPAQPLLFGEYALVEILPGNDINQSVWDFRVDPRLGDNPASLGPLLK